MSAGSASAASSSMSAGAAGGPVLAPMPSGSVQALLATPPPSPMGSCRGSSPFVEPGPLVMRLSAVRATGAGGSQPAAVAGAIFGAGSGAQAGKAGGVHRLHVVAKAPASPSASLSTCSSAACSGASTPATARSLVASEDPLGLATALAGGQGGAGDAPGPAAGGRRPRASVRAAIWRALRLGGDDEGAPAAAQAGGDASAAGTAASASARAASARRQLGSAAAAPVEVRASVGLAAPAVGGGACPPACGTAPASESASGPLPPGGVRWDAPEATSSLGVLSRVVALQRQLEEQRGAAAVASARLAALTDRLAVLVGAHRASPCHFKAPVGAREPASRLAC